MSNSEQPNPIIGSNSATWRCADGRFLRTTTTPIGTQLPYEAGVYVLCSSKANLLLPLFVDETKSIAGRLNENLVFHPSLCDLLSCGAIFVSYYTSLSHEDRRDWKKNLIISFDPPFNKNMKIGIKRKAAYPQ